MKNKILAGILVTFIVAGCSNKERPTLPKTDNILSDLIKDNSADLKWFNEAISFSIEDNSLTVIAEKGTDFFNNPEDGSITSTAPFFYKQVSGDFVAKALVRPDFSSMWNAVAIMVHIDDNHWIKFAFENSDATGQSIVSVVTKKVSDDANGAVLTRQDQVWLKLIRKDNVYSMHWSLDDVNYKMARLSAMPSADSVKIGIEAQCPVGESATHQIHYFGLEKTTVRDLRKGE